MPESILLDVLKKATETPNWFAVCMGLGTVFIGLISIILICKGLSYACRERDEEPKKEYVTPVVTAPTKIENRQEIIAAVSAACAEEMGTDVSAIKIISFKKI